MDNIRQIINNRMCSNVSVFNSSLKIFHNLQIIHHNIANLLEICAC